MTLPARFPVCPICHGVHKVLECVGRPQTDTEWMIDRGVRPDAARAFVDSRDRAGLGSIVLPPDPTIPNVPPYGAPERRPDPPPATPAVQEALF